MKVPTRTLPNYNFFMSSTLAKFSLRFFSNTELLFLLCVCLFSAVLIILVMSVLPGHRTFHFASKREWMALTILTCCYAIISFHQLGSSSMPTTWWQPEHTPQEIILKLPEESTFNRVVLFFGEGDNNSNPSAYQIGIHNGLLEGSADGTSWELITPLEQDRFCQYIDLLFTDLTYPYIRLTSNDPSDCIYEIAFFYDDVLLPVSIESDASSYRYPPEHLIDEQDRIPIHASYYDESYFDEVYHPRNAWEIANGQYMYPAVHPLLGTELIALSIRLLGYHPFGWRFAGALIGVLLIPLFWVLLKHLFSNPGAALFGTILFSVDFMHITTSRIATLEPMSVFFILLMFLFMVRWMKTSITEVPLSHSLRELFFCGLCTGLGIAVKWTACYSAVGLAVLYVGSLVQRGRAFFLTHSKNERPQFYRAVMITILWSFVFFLFLPILITVLSYLPAHITRDGYSISNVLQELVHMYRYHVNLTAAHPYQSTWKQWLLDLRPVWYYGREDSYGTYHTIACFTNPVLSYAGLVSIGVVFYHALIHRSFSSILISVGYLSALLPWCFIDRCLFAYHFYPTSFFMIASIAFLYEQYNNRPAAKHIAFFIGFLATAVFFIYLPVLTGFGTTRDYVHLLELISSWYFG